MSAIQLLAKRVPTGRSKHVGVRYFHILDSIDRDDIMLQWVPTASMIPDVMTKPLARVQFLKCIRPIHVSSECCESTCGLSPAVSPLRYAVLCLLRTSWLYRQQPRSLPPTRPLVYCSHVWSLNRL
jgi:hypothetical protein